MKNPQEFRKLTAGRSINLRSLPWIITFTIRRSATEVSARVVGDLTEDSTGSPATKRRCRGRRVRIIVVWLRETILIGV